MGFQFNCKIFSFQFYLNCLHRRVTQERILCLFKEILLCLHKAQLNCTRSGGAKQLLGKELEAASFLLNNYTLIQNCKTIRTKMKMPTNSLHSLGKLIGKVPVN